MPSIGLVIPEITCEMLEFWENKRNFAPVKPMPRVEMHLVLAHYIIPFLGVEHDAHLSEKLLMQVS